MTAPLVVPYSSPFYVRHTALGSPLLPPTRHRRSSSPRRHPLLALVITLMQLGLGAVPCRMIAASNTILYGNMGQGFPSHRGTIFDSGTCHDDSGILLYWNVLSSILHSAVLDCFADDTSRQNAWRIDM